MTTPSITVNAQELAHAAMSSPALSSARRLAEWVGQGRTLTASGVLRPVEAVQACRDLDIDLPGPKLRSALDAWELMQVWEAATAAGFLEVQGRKAWAAADLDAVGSVSDPQAALIAWLQAATIMLDLADDPCAVCLIALHQLHSAAGPVAIEQLVSAVEAEFEPDTPDAPDSEPCPHCDQVHDWEDDDEDEEDASEHVTVLVLAMVAFAAVTADDETAELTPLGVLLAESVFGRHAVPRDADAADLVSAIAQVSPAVAVLFAHPWLSARSTPDAAAELIAFAESATSAKRFVALTFAWGLGNEATDVWRELAKRPGIGAYAREWLGQLGEPVTNEPADHAWLTVDAVCALLDTLADTMPQYLIQALVAEQIGDQAAEVAELIPSSGHPRAADIMAMLTGPPSGRTARSETIIYQLKITLRGVSKPPVWRRVLVPSDITLGDLHHTVQYAMGWGDCHLHVFTTDWQEYGSPDDEFEGADDQSVRLDEILTEQGDQLSYTYDFGDDWEHDVVVEQTLIAEPGQAYPRCVAGNGACPPEDCGGRWGYAELKKVLADPAHDEHQDLLDWLGLESGEDFDPKEFSVADADARLALRVHGTAQPSRR